jgi:hypothetical protein
MLAWAIVICTAADLTIAGRWMIATVSASAAGPPGLSAAELEAPGGLPPLLARFRSGTWYPDRWAVTTSPLRLAQSVVWDSLTARPKYPMAYGVATLHGATSFSTREQRALLALIDELSIADRSGYRMRGNLSALLRQLGVDFVCLPPEGDVGGLAPVDRTRRMLAVGNDARWMRVLQPLPRVWTVHEAVVAPSPRSESLTDLMQYLHEILLPDGEPRDLRRQVVVKQADAARDPALVAHPPAGAGTRGSKAAADGQCRVERVRASLIRVQVVLDRPGWLIVNESYDPGWRAVVRTGDSVRTMRPLRGNHIMQAIPLPSGEHEVTLRYDPQSVRWGLGVSGISLLAALLATVRIIRRTWNQPRP